MEGNEPEFVIMSYDRFDSLDQAPQSVPISQTVSEDDQLIDALNKEIMALKEEIRQKELSEAEVIWYTVNMATLTKEYFEKKFEAVDRRFDVQEAKMQKMLDGLDRDLKAFVKEQDEEIARIVNKGFEHVIKQFDVNDRVIRLETIVYKIAKAINIQI